MAAFAEHSIVLEVTPVNIVDMLDKKFLCGVKIVADYGLDPL